MRIVFCQYTDHIDLGIGKERVYIGIMFCLGIVLGAVRFDTVWARRSLHERIDLDIGITHDEWQVEISSCWPIAYDSKLERT